STTGGPRLSSTGSTDVSRSVWVATSSGSPPVPGESARGAWPASQWGMSPAPSVSSSITARLRVEARPTVVSELTTAVEQHGGLVTGIDVTESGSARMTVDLTCATSGDAHAQEIVETL